MKNLTLFSIETGFKNRFYCCMESLKANRKFLFIFLLFMGSFLQGISAQGTLVPACNLVGPLVACAVLDPSDTSGDIIINLEVARSGAPNLTDPQHNLNFVYSFPTNSSGAFIRSYGTVVYNPVTNRTTQALTVFPGTSTPEFNLQANVTNTSSVPSTICECSKSVSVSKVAATSSYSPISCYGQLSTLTVVGSFSNIGQYTYTLLPSGPTNTTGVFPGLAGSEAGITYVVNVESAEGCTTTTSQTITQPAFNPVVLNCPESASISACQSDSAITAAFNAWLQSFSFTGGTNPNLTRSPQTPLLPSLCGGSTTVTWTVTDACGQPQSCTRTFTITPASGVVVGQPANSSTSACLYADQAAANAAFAAWLAQFTVSGGCAPQGSYGTPVAPAFCGGTTSVTYTVTDRCYQTSTVTRTFTITAPATVVVGQPANSSTLACSYADQAAANAAFAAWLAQFTVSGGCTPQGSYGTPVAPAFCGGTTSVTYTVTDRCYQTSTVTRTFAITAPATVVVGQPTNSSTSACLYADQAAANAAFAAWLAQFTVSGGCAPQGSYGQPTAPAFCGGTATVTYTVTDRCYQTSTVTRTFTITAPALVVVGQPANSTTSACLYADQAAANAAFATWLAGFTVSGGCAPQGSFGTPVAPSFCGGTTSVTYTVTDRCYQTTTVTRTFAITAPAAVVVGQPANSSTSACLYADQAAANTAFAAWLAQFTVSGGCAPQGSFGTPVAPAFCGGTTSVTYTVTDRCYQTTTVTRTFAITAPATVVVGQPANSSTSACLYADQAAANAAFATWLAQFTASGGCAAQGSYGTPVAPSYCGGTTSVTYTVTDRCYQTTTVTRTFAITAPPVVNVGQPANSSTLACVYIDQAAANAAFAAWLAQFTVSGGCAPQGSYGQPTAPSYCGGTVSVTYTVTDRCYQTTTVTRTFTIAAPTPVIFNCGNNVTVPACSTQAQITSAWNAFLTSTTASGGCDGVLTRTECPAPPLCGGYADVTWTYTVTTCGESTNTTTCTRRFTVASTSEVVFNCGSNVTIQGCGSQTAVDSAWNAFLASTTASGGCNGVFSRTAANSPSACGGSVDVTWTYTATACGGEATTQTCTRTFTVTESSPVTIIPGNNVTLPACSTQAQLDIAWNAFLASTTATGGCEGALTVTAANPPSLCGGFVDVTWTYTVAACGQSTCPNGTNTQSVTRRFTVAAPEVAVPVLTCPTSIEIPANQTQAAVDQAFAAWLATATASGGCNGVLTNNSQGAPSFCGGTTTVTFTYDTSCSEDATCQATFTVPPCDGGSGNNGSIGDFVWNDLNQNGIQDAGELGIAGVSVSLTGCAVSMSTTTNANGAYLFTNLPPCTYTVTFTTPAGHTASPFNQGSNDGIDSDSNGGVVSGIILATAENNLTIDAGFYLLPTQGLEGCTLGYWKNHTNRWCDSYRTCDRFGDVFTNAPERLANLTLLEALNLGGGGIYNLARQGVAALLNACGGDVNYAGYEDDTQLVIDAVNQAYAIGGTAPGTLASQLDTFNNTGCPLGGTRATNATNCTEDDDKTPRMKVLLHPNPYTDNFNLEITTTSVDKVGVAVYDMMGKLLEKQEVNLEDVPALKVGNRYPSGVYNVIVTQGTEVKTLRVIKR